MFLKKRWSLLLLKHRRQTAKFQFVGQFNCTHFNYLYANCIKIGIYTQMCIGRTLYTSYTLSEFLIHLRYLQSRYYRTPTNLPRDNRGLSPKQKA